MAGFSLYRLLLLLNTGLLLCILSWACNNWLGSFLLCYLILNWKRTIVNANTNQWGAHLTRVVWFVTPQFLNSALALHCKQQKQVCCVGKQFKVSSIRQSYYRAYLLLHFLCPVCPAHIYYSWWCWGRREWRKGTKEEGALKKRAMKFLLSFIRPCILEVKIHFTEWILVCFDASIIPAHLSESVLQSKKLIIFCLDEWTTKRRIILQP